jgi:lysophospholipase L1-like esterase
MPIKTYLSILFPFLATYNNSVAQTSGNLPPINSLSTEVQHRLQYDWAWLGRYREANEQLLAMAADSSRVVFMGDSITEGWEQGMPDFFKQHPSFVNRGIGGQTTGQVLLRARPDIIDLKPKAMVLMIGINDIAENNGAYREEETFGNIISILELMKAARIKVVLCSITPANRFVWRSSITDVGDKIISLNKRLNAYAKQHNIAYCNYYDVLVGNDKGTKAAYTNDGVHITPEGYRLMAETVMGLLHKI